MSFPVHALNTIYTYFNPSSTKVSIESLEISDRIVFVLYLFFSLHVNVCLYNCLSRSVRISVYITVRMSVYKTVRMSVYLTVRASVYITVCLDLSVCMSI